jgi:hypothetical protein
MAIVIAEAVTPTTEGYHKDGEIGGVKERER